MNLLDLWTCADSPQLDYCGGGGDYVERCLRASAQTQTPVYRASQKVSIQPARNDFGLLEALRILLRNYVKYLNTDLRAGEVIERLELDMTPGPTPQ